MMDGLKISIPQRLVLLRITLVATLLVSLFMTARLWAGYRYFPRTPALETLSIPVEYDLVLTLLLMVFWLCSLFLRYQRLFIVLAFLVAAALVMLDINRLQPWFFIYNSLLFVFVFYNGRVDNPNTFTSVFILLQLILASVYFYTGLSQLNPNFAGQVFPDLIQPLQALMSERQFLFFKKLGKLVPFLLMFIGIGFVISPMRYLSIAVAVPLHLLLLVFLFPSERNTNSALWFSNLSFLVMAVLLFSGKTKQRYFSPTFLFKMPVFYLVVAVFLVLPALNVTNRWPDFLASNQRSGNNQRATLYLSPRAQHKLPPYLRYFCRPQHAGFVLDHEAWCRHELGADCYPSARVFTRLGAHLQNLTGTGVKDVQLSLQPAQTLLVIP